MPRPFIYVTDHNKSGDVAKMLVENKIVFFYEFRNSYRFYFHDVNEAQDALDIVSELNANPVLVDPNEDL